MPKINSKFRVWALILACWLAAGLALVVAALRAP
jgi:hypothetical protein